MNAFRCLLAISILAPALALAQAYPVRPITIIVPYPPGGLIDLVARIIQPGMQTELGQSVLVENRSGAGGNVGAEAVVRAAPDGYTLLLGNPSLGISPVLYPKLAYQPLKDLAYIGQYGKVPNVLIVHPSFPAKNIGEFIALLKASPGNYNYGSLGHGTSTHLSMELLKSLTNTFVVHIPFRGAGPATAALLGGETQMMFDNLPPQVGNIKAGKARPIAVTSLARTHVFPDVPTLDESGLKGFEVSSYFGLNAPAGTPKEIIARIHLALTRTTSQPDVREQLVSRGAEVIQGTPEDYMNYVKSEIERWGPVVKRAGIVLD
ncbi:MAG: Bug family tripartite tricarboxylate transporter substrate binding protein [Burkholderiales bacterium]